MADQGVAKWTKVVADFESAGLSQRVFAAERGVPLSNLRYWLYRLRKETRPLRVEAEQCSDQAPERGSPAGGSILVPVRVIASAASSTRQPEPVGGLLELDLPSGTRVRFPAGTDLDYLKALAAAL